MAEPSDDLIRFVDRWQPRKVVVDHRESDPDELKNEYNNPKYAKVPGIGASAPKTESKG